MLSATLRSEPSWMQTGGQDGKTQAQQRICLSMRASTTPRGMNTSHESSCKLSSAQKQAHWHFMAAEVLRHHPPLRWQRLQRCWVCRLHQTCPRLLQRERCRLPLLLLQQPRFGRRATSRTHRRLQTAGLPAPGGRGGSRTKTDATAARWSTCEQGVSYNRAALQHGMTTHNVSKNSGDASSQRC